MNETRSPRRVRDMYPTLLELGLLAALLLVTLAFLLSKRIDGPTPTDQAAISQVLEMEPIPITIQRKTPPPPARPTLPVEDPALDPEGDISFADIDEIPTFDWDNMPARSLEDEVVPFILVEQKPALIGGPSALYQYMRDHNLYPEMARRSNVEGIVVVEFTVGVDGLPRNIHVAQCRPEGLGFEEAGMQAIAAMRFTPGMQRDHAVKVENMQQPIRFKLK